MASLRFLLSGALLVLAAAGCTTDNLTTGSLPANGPTTVAFESVDGPPPEVFRSFVRQLDEAARARQIAVVAQGHPAHYRIRLYLAAEVSKGRTSIAWVWDVYDREQRRAFRIDGREKAVRSSRDAWQTADDAVLGRIARTGMERLSTFLTPDARPGTPPAAPAAPPGSGTAVAQAGGTAPSPSALAFASGSPPLR